MIKDRYPSVARQARGASSAKAGVPAMTRSAPGTPRRKLNQGAEPDSTAGDFETLLGMHGMGSESAAAAESRVPTNQTTPLHSQPKDPITPPKTAGSLIPESTNSPEAQGSKGTKQGSPGSLANAKQKMEGIYRGNWVPKLKVPGWHRIVGGSNLEAASSQELVAVQQTGQSSMTAAPGQSQMAAAPTVQPVSYKTKTGRLFPMRNRATAPL